MKKLDRAVKMLSNKKIRNEQIKDAFEKGNYRINFTGKINPIQECAIKFYFLKYIQFIDYCGGRVFYKVLEEYMEKHIGDKKHTIRQNIYDMEAYGLVKQSDKKIFNNSLISLSQPSIDFLNNRKSLNKINLVNLYKSTYKGKLLIEQSQAQKERLSNYLKNNDIAEKINNKEFMNTLEEKNIFLLDIDEKDIVHLALFDINETLDFSEFKRILENNLLPINKNFYIKIFTANEDREEVLDKIFIREIKEKGAYIKNPLFKGCMAININIDDIFKASGSFSRGVRKDKQSKNILKPVEVPKKPLNDTESIEVLELEKFEWEDDIF